MQDDVYGSSVHLVLGTVSHVVGGNAVPVEDDSQHTRGVKFQTECRLYLLRRMPYYTLLE